MSPIPGCVNSSSFIISCQIVSMRCCTVLMILSITQMGSSSSFSWALLCLFVILIIHILPHRRNMKHPLECLVQQPSSPEKSFRPLCSSIWRFQLSLYYPALADPLLLGLQLAFLPQQSLSQYNPRSILLALHCLRCEFLIILWLQAPFLIESCAMPQALGLSLRPTRSCPQSFDDVIAWTSLSMCHLPLPEVAKSSSPEN